MESWKNAKLVLISILVLFLLILVYFKHLPTITGNVIKLAPCPFECCSYGFDFYEIKDCGQYYECINHKCIPKDTDHDGLTDIKEIELGTNIFSQDTDEDGLGDGDEVFLYKTNPLKANTDCDRYNDGEEIKLHLNPLKPNTAVITTEIVGESGEYNILNIAKDGIKIASVMGLLNLCGQKTFGICILDSQNLENVLSSILEDTIYTTKTFITIKNTGDDYTSFVTFDVIYKIEDKPLYIKEVSIGRIDPNDYKTEIVTYEVKIKDIPVVLWNYILGKYNVKAYISNLRYEKFPQPC